MELPKQLLKNHGSTTVNAPKMVLPW